MDAAILNNIVIGFYQYIGISLCILGNLGNIFCLMIFSQKSWRKNVCVFYFLICLLFDTIYINSTVLGYSLIYGFDINLTKSNIIICKVFNYFALLFSTLSPTILISASIDRLLISSQNIDTRLYSSRRLAYFSISTTTVFWLIFFLHVPIKYNIHRFGSPLSFCLFTPAEFYAKFLVFTMLIIKVLSFVTMIILSILSFKNVRQIRSIPRRQRQVGRTMHKKDFQLLRCLFAKDIIYIICNTFLCVYVIFNTITSFRVQKIWEDALDAFLFRVSSLIHYIPSCVSFGTYIVISKAFRQSFQRLLWKMIRKNSTTHQTDETNEQEMRQIANQPVIGSTIVL